MTRGGAHLFDDLKQIDKISADNKYFKKELKRIKKNPLYRIDYKKQLVTFEAKVEREINWLDKGYKKINASAIKEMEKTKVAEKRDMFLSKLRHKQVKQI